MMPQLLSLPVGHDAATRHQRASAVPVAALRGHDLTVAERSVTEYVMQHYVAERRWGWSAAEHRGIREDDRRSVVFTKATRETGGYDVRPISVPRITMHVRALEARA
jgi:hypothetical protein